MTNLNDQRIRINDIDSQILKLLENRMKISKEIGEIKLKNDLPIYNSEREKDIISMLQEKTKCSDNMVKEIWEIIFKHSRDIQISLKCDIVPCH